MLYLVCKWLHVLGVIILVGNVTATAVWKVFADRTGDARVVAFAQRLVTITDWSLTVGGIVLVLGGGFGAVYASKMPPFAQGWLRNGEILFAISGSIWLFILLPTQIRQAREARTFGQTGGITASYRRDATRWLVWGIVATVPLVAATWFMIVKPA